MPEDAYRKNIATFIADESDNLFDSSFQKLLNQRRFRNNFNCYANKIEDFFAIPLFRQRVSQKRIIHMYKVLLKGEAEKLTLFAEIRRRFERAFLLEQYERANSILDDCYANLGESMWYLRSRMLLLSSMGDTQKTQEYFESCKNRSKDAFVTSLIGFSQIISDSGDAALHLRQSVLSTIREFEAAGHLQSASLLELMFVPTSLVNINRYESSLLILQVLPIVDIYMYLMEIGQSIVVHEIRGGDPIQVEDEIVRFAIELNKSVNDPALSRLVEALNNVVTAEISAEGKNLLSCYEEGDYENVIKTFWITCESLANPLAYLNIVAKAYAYLNMMPSNSAYPVLSGLLNHFVQIYAVSAPPESSEESIIAQIVRLKGMTFSAHIQLSLFVSLPYRYTEQHLKISSALSLSISPEITPLAASFYNSGNLSFGERFGVNDRINIPLYRRTKRQICQLVNSNSDDALIENEFRRLFEQTPLKKEYFELYSEYCLQNNLLASLVKLCADSLALNTDYYACFPLVNLVAEIENNAGGDIEEIVVIYYYTKFVTSKMDYLLHERFEDYISDRSVTRPSQLLGQVVNLMPTELVFFRDVCRPDVMDFLACFDSINDLRAERIEILNRLADLGAVSKEFCVEEVEEIVGQVVLDAATSKFNSAKIFIDDASIRIKHKDFVSSMVVFYKQSKDDGDDRHTLLDEGEDDSGVAKVYLSGGKNSIALRIISHLRDAFLFDEKFGLAKNLSTEIRHGFFANLISARLEERMLINEIGPDGLYCSNRIWRDYNQFLLQEVWDDIDNCLKEFSRKFNELIAIAEEWMNIKENDSETERVFVYLVEMTNILAVRKLLDQADCDAEKVSSAVMDLFWESTEAHLTAMRNKLNYEFRDRLDGLFSSLLAEINVVKHGVPLIELTNAILLTREEIKEDVTTAAEWFRRAADPSLGDQTLESVVNIAIKAFHEVNRAKSSIDVDLPLNFREITIIGATVKPFVIAIINLLDNCYRRSGLGATTPVSLSGSQTPNGAQINIRNALRQDKYEELQGGLLSEIQSKLAEGGAILMRTEGGSGLSKANYQMACVSGGSGVRVVCKDSTFTAEITYESQNSIS